MPSSSSSSHNNANSRNRQRAMQRQRMLEAAELRQRLLDFSRQASLSSAPAPPHAEPWIIAKHTKNYKNTKPANQAMSNYKKKSLKRKLNREEEQKRQNAARARMIRQQMMRAEENARRQRERERVQRAAFLASLAQKRVNNKNKKH